MGPSGPPSPPPPPLLSWLSAIDPPFWTREKKTYSLLPRRRLSQPRGGDPHLVRTEFMLERWWHLARPSGHVPGAQVCVPFCSEGLLPASPQSSLLRRNPSAQAREPSAPTCFPARPAPWALYVLTSGLPGRGLHSVPLLVVFSPWIFHPFVPGSRLLRLLATSGPSLPGKQCRDPGVCSPRSSPARRLGEEAGLQGRRLLPAPQTFTREIKSVPKC